MVPVGTLPERLSVSDDGCKTVTANRGSCDLSLIDNTRLLADQLDLPPSNGDGPMVHRLRIVARRGAATSELLAAPAEVLLLPVGTVAPPVVPGDAGAGDAVGDAGQSGDGADDAAGGDGGDGGAPIDADAGADAAGASAAVVSSLQAVDATPGDAAPAQAAVCEAVGPARRAVVSFPGCDLVALVEIDTVGGTATVVSALKMMVDGSLVATTEVSCPVECTSSGTMSAPFTPGPDAGAAGAADAGVTDGGVASGASGRAGASALALNPEDGTLYVGGGGSPAIATARVGLSGPASLTAGTPIVLAEGAMGVNRLRLSRDPYRTEQWVGGRGLKFLYAFARDGSVRVVQLAPRGPVECDVNAEEDLAPGMASQDLALPCLEVGQRKIPDLLSRGPGLRLPDYDLAAPSGDPNVGMALPVDIAFTEIGTAATGLLLSSNGFIYHVGLGSPGLTDTSGERFHNIRRDPNRGSAPSATLPPTRSFSDALVGFPTRVAFATGDIGPQHRGFHAPEHRSHHAVPVFSAAEPGPARQRPAALGGRVARSPCGSPACWKLPEGKRARPAVPCATRGRTYCASGVEVGDVVSMIGCDDDNECDPDRNEVCYRAAPGAQGACLPRTLVDDEGSCVPARPNSAAAAATRCERCPAPG